MATATTAMERFAQAITAGGVALVAGLWLAALFTWASTAWLAGVVLAALGTAALAWGIWIEVDVDPVA